MMIDYQYIDQEKIKIHTAQNDLCFAVIADTHVPDRVDALHPKLLPLLRENNVNFILHCGDVIEPSILEVLSEVAPVFTVLGNRDAFFTKAAYPFKLEIEVFQRKIGLYHGFLSIKHYFPDKLQYIFKGYHFEKYFHIGRQLFPDADILCYGHTHTAEIRRFDDQLVINPGTAGPRSMNGGSSFAILHVHRTCKMNAHFIALQDYKNNKGQWIKST